MIVSKALGGVALTPNCVIRFKVELGIYRGPEKLQRYQIERLDTAFYASFFPDYSLDTNSAVLKIFL
jgi:hypothetical protein